MHTKTNLYIIFREQLLLLVIVISYIVAGYFIQYILDIYKMMNLKFSYKILNTFAIYFSIIFLNIQILRKDLNKYLNLRSVCGVILVIILAGSFISAFSSFKQAIPIIQDFTWDYTFMKLDYMLHFGHHPWKIFSFLLTHKGIIRLIDFLYMLWFPTLFLSCMWMGWSSRRQLRFQFFTCACLTWILLGTLLAAFLSSAGPCYYSVVTDSHLNPYEPLMTQLMKIHESVPLFAVRNQVGLWEAYQKHIWLPFGGISAMPSLHVAIAVLIAIVGWRANVWAGILLTIYAAVIQIGSIILAWHYAIDGYMSTLLIILLWKTVGKMPFFKLDGETYLVDNQADFH